MKSSVRILHVDDNVHDRKLVRDVLEKEHCGYVIIEADSREKLIRYLKEEKFDLVLSDFNILGFDGLQVIQIVKEMDPDLPVIIITGTGSEEVAIQAMKLGAADYVIKSVKHIQGLPPTINTVLEYKRNKEQQKKIEEALHHAENKYQKILESMMDGFAFVDMSGVIIDCNKAFQLMLGYTLSELQVLKYTDITPLKWHHIEEEIVSKQVIPNGHSDIYEKEYIRKDGTLFPVEIRTFLYRNDAGENEGFWAIIRDITIRKHNEDVLIESEWKHRIVADNTYDWEFWCDKDRRFVYCSPSCYRITGYKVEEFMANPSLMEQIVYPEDQESYREHIIKEEIEEGPFELNFRIIHKNESVKWIGHVCQPIVDENGNRIGRRGSNRDITTRILSAEAIRKSEARFRGYFDLSIAGIAITSPDMRWIEVNEYLCDMMGYTRKELLSVTWTELTHPEDVHLDLEKFQEVMQGEIEGYSIDKRFVRKDGRVVWTSLSVKCVRDINRKVDYFMALLFDISARKQAEESLQKTTSELQLIIKNMLNAFVIWESVFDENGNYVSFRFGPFNDAYADIAKIKQDEVLGSDVFEVWPETEASWVEVYGKVAITGIPQTFDMYHEPTKGWYHCNAYRPSDSPKMICVIFEDITARKQMEEKLAWEQYLMYTLLDNIPDYIYFKDLESRFVRINKALASVFGLEDPLMALGKSDMDFFKTEHSLEAFNDEQNIIRTGIPIIGKEEMETWLHRSPDWVSTTKMPLKNAKGEIIGTFGISRNITDLKKIQNDLLQAKEKAEESSRLKTAFLQNISHEIRTPLNAIIGFSSILGNPELPAEKRAEYMNIINISNDQLLSIISGIIALATLEAGQEKLDEKETHINELLKNVYEQFSINFHSTRVNFSYYTGLSDESSIVLTDPVKLTQIIVNLVGNALKFTNEGFVNFGYRMVANSIQFFVEDSGIGIPEDMHDLIFERFRQVDNTATRKYGGTGLGLALSRGYVNLLGGTIEISSKPGAGSTFTVTLPYKPVSHMFISEGTNHAAQKKRIAADKLILIAEDDNNNFILVEEILISLNLKIIRASNGLEAIDMCSGAQPPDLVLMDIKMPIMDGIEATKRIKLFSPEIPVIALTAYTSENDKKRIYESGCDGYIEKPIREKALYDTLLKYLQSP